MSVIVKGMKMPQGSCEWVDAEGHLHRCKLLNGDDDCKMQEGMCADATWEEQFAGCPLVEVKEPHGRLIDIKSVEDGKFVNADNEYQKWWNGALESVINYAKTIIEAEGSEE